MPPKKNAFFMFMQHFRSEQIKLGKKSSSFKELGVRLAPVWAAMSVEEKNQFKTLANEYNSNLKEETKKDAPEFLLSSTFSTCSLEDLLPDVFNSITDKEELLNQKIFLLHVNCHSFVKDNYYFPAEIAIIEFSLKRGVLRRYHTLVGLSKIYPRGYAGGMRQHSDKFHKIACWTKEHPEDYKAILEDVITFLQDGQKYNSEVCDGNLDLPELFTIETEPGQNVMAVKSSLNRLYHTVLPNYDASKPCKSVFKVKSVERLFLEILKRLDLHKNPLSIKSGNTVRDILGYNLFGKGLSCAYHEMRDISFKCSSAYVLQWMTNIFQHLNALSGFEIKAAFHVPLILGDGTKMFIKDASKPISMRDFSSFRGMCIEDDDLLDNGIDDDNLE